MPEQIDSEYQTLRQGEIDRERGAFMEQEISRQKAAMEQPAAAPQPKQQGMLEKAGNFLKESLPGSETRTQAEAKAKADMQSPLDKQHGETTTPKPAEEKLSGMSAEQAKVNAMASIQKYFNGAVDAVTLRQIDLEKAMATNGKEWASSANLYNYFKGYDYVPPPEGSTPSEIYRAAGADPAILDSEWATLPGHVIGGTLPWMTISKVFGSLTRGALSVLPGEAKNKLLAEVWNGIAGRLGGGAAAGGITSFAAADPENKVKHGLVGAGIGAGAEAIVLTAFDRMHTLADQRWKSDILDRGVKVAAEKIRRETNGAIPTEKILDEVWQRAGKMAEARGFKDFGIMETAKVSKAVGQAEKQLAETVVPKDVSPQPSQTAKLTPSQEAQVAEVFRPNRPVYGWQTKNQIHENIDKQTWAVVTADNPQHPVLVQGGNKALAQWLLNKGFKAEDITPTTGHFAGIPEDKNFLVPGMTPEEVLQQLKDFGQGSTATNLGLLYQDGKLNPSQGGAVVGDEATKQRGYTVLHTVDGDIPFSLNIDFNTTTNWDGSPIVSPQAGQAVAEAPSPYAGTAEAYNAAVHEPNKPEVKAAYDAFKKDILKAYDEITSEGTKMSLHKGEGNPYKNVDEMFKDLDENKNLSVFQGGMPPADHPLSEQAPGQPPGITYNHLFRFIHDARDHGLSRGGFDFPGETKAYETGRQFYSPEAQGAYFTETQGQALANEKLNAGVVASPDQMKFVEQKATLLPEKLYQSQFDLGIREIDKKIEAIKTEIGKFIDEPQVETQVSSTGKKFSREKQLEDDDPRVLERSFKQLSELPPEDMNKITTVPSPQGGRGGVVDDKSGRIVWRDSHAAAQEAVRKMGGKVGDLVFDVETPIGRKILTINQFDLLTNPSRAAELAKGKGETKMQLDQAFQNLDKLMEERASLILNEIRTKGPTEQSFLDKIDASANAARERLAARFGSGHVVAREAIGAAVEGVASIRDLTTIGVSLIAHGVKSLRDFQKRLVAEVGHAVDQKQATKAYDDAVKRLSKLSISAGGEMTSVDHLLKLAEEGQYGGKWYNKAWDEILNFTGGDTAEARRFARLTAALSQQMNPRRNLQMSIDAWWHYKAGDQEGLEEALSAHPFPTAIVNARRALADEPFGDSSFKVKNFAENLMGNLDAVTIDIGMKSAFGLPGDKSLTEPQHAALERIIKDLAKTAGVQPAEFQAAVWAADRIVTEGRKISVKGGKDQYEADVGKNFDQIFQEEIKNYAQKLLDEGKFKLDEKGAADAYLTYLIARVLIGAGIGFSEGDTIEERLANAAGGALIAGIAPSAVRFVGKYLARLLSSRGSMKAVRDIMERTGLDDEFKRIFDPKSLRPAVPPPAGATGALASVPGSSQSQGQQVAGASVQQPGAVVASPPGAAVQPAKAPELFEVVSKEKAKAFHSADVSTIDLGDKELKINYDQVVDKEASEKILKYLTKENLKRIDEARRGKISIPKTKEMARKLGLDFDTIMSWRRGYLPNAEETQALIDFHGDTLKETSKVMNDLAQNPGNPELEEKFWRRLNNVQMVLEHVYGARAEWGRAGNMWGTDAQGYIKVSNQIVSTMGTLGIDPSTPLAAPRRTKITPTRLAVLLLATTKTPAQLTAWVDKATRPSKSDMILEAMYGGWFLSSPATLTTNALGNAITSALAVPERFMAAGIGTGFSVLEKMGVVAPSADHVTGVEAAAYTFGLLDSMDKALQIAGHAFKTGERSFAGSKVEMSQEAALTAENLGVTGPFGSAIDLLGKAMRGMPRGMLATDEFFKMINAFAEIQAQAYRRASAQGLEGKDFAEAVIDTFKELPVNSIEAARQNGAYLTFTKLMGPTGSSMQRAMESLAPRYRIPIKFFIPFTTTPVNIFKYGAERVPVIAPIMQSFRDDFNAGGARRDSAMAKIGLGSMLIMAGAYAALQGKIVGHKPLETAEAKVRKQAGEQEYSVNLGNGVSVQFSKVDPMGFILGLGADWATLYGAEFDWEHEKGESVQKLFMYGVLPIAWNLNSKTYLEGAARLFRGLAARDTKDVEDLLGGSAGALVPGFVRQIQRTGIANDTSFKASRDMWDKFLQLIPGASDKVPAERDVFGEKVMKPGALGPDLISGIAVSKMKDTPEYQALLENNFGGTPPGRWVWGNKDNKYAREPNPNEGIELNDKQYEQLQIIAGKEFKRMVSDAIKQDFFQKFSKYGKQEHLEKLHSVAKEIARGKLLGEDKDLQEGVKKKLTERTKALWKR